jgi:nucleotide-binding universal stress UspA family protein
MNRNVAVGFNASTESIFAVKWAAAEAEARGVALHIIQGDRAHGEAFASGDIEALAEGDITPIQGVCELVRGAHPDLLVVTSVVHAEWSGQALGQHLEEAELVVVGASSHPGAAGFWLGNTPRWLVRNSSCPVVMTHRSIEPWRPRRIVVGVNGPDHRAVEWACDEGDLHGVPVVVAHVAEAGSGRSHDTERTSAVLDDAVDVARSRGDTPVSGMLLEGEAVSALLGLSRLDDFLVLGLRRRNRAVSALLGSTVDGILDHAHMPVAVVPDVGTIPAKVP